MTPVLDGHRRDAVRPGRRGPGGRWRRAGRASVGFAFEGTARPTPAGRHLRRRGRARPWRSSAPPARASRPSPACWSGSSTRRRARCCSTASTCAGCARARSAARRRSSPRARSSSTTPSAATSPSAASPTDDEVWAALRVAAADDFVAALPDGLDTRVGERGATLSGGQRQRLALARAVVRRPRLLVLDDATSAVDPSVEARILDALRDSDEPATVVVDRLPAGHHRAGRRGGLARARRVARPRHARRAARRGARATRRWSAPTPRPGGGGMTRARDRRRPTAARRAHSPPCAGACG